MLSYEECRKIAERKAAQYNVNISKAYTLGDAYVFETDVEFTGAFPLVVDKNGATYGLWHYLNEKDLTMDDMSEL